MGWGVAIVLLSFIVYIPAYQAGFVWDDGTHLLDNVVLTEGGLLRAWFSTDMPNYWPLTWTSYWIEHQLWGLNPLGYHVVNVALHTASSLLIWRTLARLGIPHAGFVALLFAIHPVNVESVAWVAQRKNVLSMFFFLLAILVYLRFEDDEIPRGHWLAVAAFLLSMLAKGAGAAMPVVLLLLAWWRRGRISRLDIRRSIPFFAVALVMSGFEIGFQYGRSIGDTVVRTDNFFSRLAGAGWGVWFFAYKALLPTDLSFIYPRWTIDPTRWLSYVPSLAIAGITTLAWHFRNRWGRPLIFAIAYFVLTLAPVLGFFDIYFMRYSFVADHYQYIAIIAVIALAVATSAALLARLPAAPFPSRVLGMLLLVALAIASWQRAQIFRDEETLWLDTIAKNPGGYTAHYNLAGLLLETRRFEEAAQYYSNALKIWSASPKANNNLGVTLRSQGKFAAAAERFRRVLEIDPHHAAAHANLASVLVVQKRKGQAIEHYRAALESDPSQSEVYYALGELLRTEGRTGPAVLHLRESLRLAPESPQALISLAMILATTSDERFHDPEEALRLARRALALTDPSNARAIHARALALKALRDGSRAN